MRGDFEHTSYKTDGARTQSEVHHARAVCGINVLKLARYLNIIAGTALVVVSIFEIIGLFTFANPGALFLDIYLFFFGLLIMGSSINLSCIGRNFFFLLTGVGKGLFNMFVGTLLFLNESTDTISAANVMGWCLLVSGAVFLLLSCCK